MPEERKISPYWLIPVGLLLGVGGALGLAVALAREEEAPPEEGPPEEVPPVVLDEFYMPSKITDISIWEHDILQWHYHQITYRVRITNYGNAPGTHTISWEHYYNGTMFSDGQAQITLQPGESYEWSGIVDVDFSRCTKATCKLYGDWPENNYSEGVVIEGVPVS